MSDTGHEEQAPPPWSLPARLAVGLVQGGLFYALHQAEASGWSKLRPGLHGASILVASFVPLILLAGIGHLRRATLAVWAFAATAILAGLALYSSGNVVADPGAYAGSDTLDFALVQASAVALFIAHHLIEGADVERRLVASYRTYFDTAWKHAFQLGLSLAFIGVFWMLLWLGAALFKLIGITAIQDILKEAWFYFPVLGLAFAAAVHLTDARAGLTRGARTLGLTLMSWLTPIMALIVAGFLLALPFTGLKPLWDTRSATAVLLAASAVLIVLINAAYQDGEREQGAHVVLRWAARVAAAALTPLTLIAGYAIWLRVGQHGLTPDRVMAVALTLLSGCYALGYGLAAVLPGAWMKPLERTNIVNACVALVLFLALFTPVADPRRLSVDDQVARLTSGKVAPGRFDYDFLRFESGRYGMEALQRLKRTSGTPRAAAIAIEAGKAILRTARIPVAPSRPAPPLKVYPAGARLPAGFDTRPDALQNCPRDGVCEAYLADLDGDGVAEMLVNGGFDIAIYKVAAAGAWTNAAQISTSGCQRLTEALRGGRFTTAPALWRDIEIDGARLAVEPVAADACQARSISPPAADKPTSGGQR